MSIFSEDECGNIIEECLEIPAFEALQIIKSPDSHRHQLHGLYYALVLKLSPKLPQSSDHLGNLPALQLDSGWQPHSSVTFTIPRLAVLLNKKLSELHPDFPFSMRDILKPRKSRTLEIVSFLLNAAIFDSELRRLREERMNVIKELKESNKKILQQQSFDRDIEDRNERTTNQLNEEITNAQTKRKKLHDTNRQHYEEYTQLSEVAQEIMNETEKLNSKLSGSATYIEHELSPKIRTLKIQLLDEKFQQNLDIVRKDLEELTGENVIYKGIRNNFIKSVECYETLENLEMTTSTLISSSREISESNEEKFDTIKTNQKDVDKEEAALSEMRREISSVKEMEYKITKEDVVFKNKRDKADSLTEQMIESEKLAQEELKNQVETLGEHYTEWLRVKSIREDLEQKCRTYGVVSQNVTQYADEFKEFRKTLSEPSKILINSLSDEKRNLEQITEINKAKMPGISNLLNSTAKQIYASLIKPYSGQDHFDSSNIEKIANSVQLLLSMFDQITEEFKMSRVIDTATITALMDQVIADIESDGDPEFMKIVKEALLKLNTELEKIQLDNYQPPTIPDISKVEKFPAVHSPTDDMDIIIGEIKNLDIQYKMFKDVGEAAKIQTSKNTTTQFALDWAKIFTDSFDEFLLGGVEKFNFKSRNVLWEYAHRDCSKQLENRENMLKEEAEQMKSDKVERILRQRIEEDKRKIEEEKKRLEEERVAEEKRKEEEQIAEEKRKEEERIAEEKRKEEERIAEEKSKEEELKRIADEKESQEISEELDTTPPTDPGKENTAPTQDSEARKRKIRRQTYNVSQPSKIRKVSDDDPYPQPAKNATYTKETNKTVIIDNKTYTTTAVKTVNLEELRRDENSDESTQISFNTPVKSSTAHNTIIIDKSQHARRTTFTVKTPLLDFVRNSTRRSDLEYTPELLAAAKRPSAILPVCLGPQEERLIAKYCDIPDEATPRRRSLKSRLSSVPSTPIQKLFLRIKEKYPKTEPPRRKSLPPRVNVTARSNTSLYNIADVNVSYDSKLTIEMNSFSFRSSDLGSATPRTPARCGGAIKGKSLSGPLGDSSLKSELDSEIIVNIGKGADPGAGDALIWAGPPTYTPCGPRMGDAQSLLTPQDQEKLDFSLSEERPTKQPGVTEDVKVGQPDFSEEVELQDSEQGDMSLCKEKEVEQDDMSLCNEKEPELTDEERMSCDEEVQTDPAMTGLIPYDVTNTDDVTNTVIKDSDVTVKEGSKSSAGASQTQPVYTEEAMSAEETEVPGDATPNKPLVPYDVTLATPNKPLVPYDVTDTPNTIKEPLVPYGISSTSLISYDDTQDSIQDLTTLSVQPEPFNNNKSVGCGMNLIEEGPPTKDVGCGGTPFGTPEPHSKSVACGRTMIADMDETEVVSTDMDETEVVGTDMDDTEIVGTDSEKVMVGTVHIPPRYNIDYTRECGVNQNMPEPVPEPEPEAIPEPEPEPLCAPEPEPTEAAVSEAAPPKDKLKPKTRIKVVTGPIVRGYRMTSCLQVEFLYKLSRKRLDDDE